jgi:hypothetical protein
VANMTQVSDVAPGPLVYILVGFFFFFVLFLGFFVGLFVFVLFASLFKEKFLILLDICSDDTHFKITSVWIRVRITVVKLPCEDVFGPGDFVLPLLVINVKNVNKPYFKNFGIKQ